MKKILLTCVSILLLMLSACSVQEKMSPLVFIERLQRADENLVVDAENMYIENNKYILFAWDEVEKAFVMEITADEDGNAKKICLACNKTSKAEKFRLSAESIIKAYAPGDNACEVLSVLMKSEWGYHDTQWHSYAYASGENGMFFSVKSKKLSTESDAVLSLKPNDITLNND